jgi:acyl carrier protein
MTEGLSEIDMSRLARTGVRALSSEEGLELFDGALRTGEALTLPLPLDLQALRAQARMGVLPAILSDLVRMPTKRSGEQSASLARRLAATPEPERENVLLDLVRTQVATVLGHNSPEAIDTQRTFKELGFDSLTAVELRNRLNTTTGLRLPATLIFDYPTTSATASYILDKLSPGFSKAGESDDREDGVRKALTSIPLVRIREAGLMEILLELANHRDQVSSSTGDDDVHAIDTMDVNSLVQKAIEGSAAEPAGEAA